MKKLATLVAALALLALGTAAFAADQATVNVTATVTGSCYFNSAVGPTNPALALDFGSFASTGAANAAPILASATLDVYCSGTFPWVISSSTATFQLAYLTNTIPYALTLNGAAPPLAGGGSVGPTTVTIGGTIPIGGVSATQVPGVYTQTVTLSLTP